MRQQGKHAEYLLNEQATRQEDVTSYADENPLRRGSKTLIRFPLRVGEQWRDDFSEPGEYRAPYEHYFYDYHESARSIASAIEEIRIGAGTFRAIRIDRVASWEKSRPRAADTASQRRGDANTKVSGVTLSQLWYVPSLGRAVLKASRRVGDAYYGSKAENLLDHGQSDVIELLAYQNGDARCAAGDSQYARQAEQYFPIGYAVAENDTWRWALQMHEHHPQRR